MTVPFTWYAKIIIKLLFPKANLNEIYVAFGKTIYESKPISKDLLVHEKVHLKQQGYSYIKAVWWWIKYKASKKFRYSQELEAYGTQLRFIYQRTNYKQEAKRAIAECLSHPMYNMVTYEQALKDLP